MSDFHTLRHWLPMLVAVVGTFLGLSYILPQAYIPWTSQVTAYRAPVVHTPYTSSFGSWWHPDGLLKPFRVLSRNWNLLYHLGGNGPWIEKIDGVVEGGIAAPPGCIVEQVHMMSRHAERYPTTNAGARHLALMERIKSSGIQLEGDLAFVNDWHYFTSDPGVHFEQLTSTGPYAGTLEAFTTGVKLRTRYQDLLLNKSSTRFWASDSARVIESARYFADGFFGRDWKSKNLAELQVIPEASDLGADTLTPGDTCLLYLNDTDYGHDQGVARLARYQASYLPAVSERLAQQNPDITFTDLELYSMQEMCGFETIVRGWSPWCDVFTELEWRQFEYARDVIHYYRAGPGNRYAGAMGWLWLNATLNLMKEGSSAGSSFFSFVHDGDIIPMVTALDLFPEQEDLPTYKMFTGRNWRTSQVTPMGGRVIFELLHCRPGSAVSPPSDQSSTEFVRVNVNDGIVELPSCSIGSYGTCRLKDFERLVKRRGALFGDFRDVCGLNESAPERITFLHQ